MSNHSPLGTFAIVVKLALFFIGFFLASAWILVTAIVMAVGKALSRPFRRQPKDRE